jgi:hypothetical protein
MGLSGANMVRNAVVFVECELIVLFCRGYPRRYHVSGYALAYQVPSVLRHHRLVHGHEELSYIRERSRRFVSGVHVVISSNLTDVLLSDSQGMVSIK